MIGPCRIDCTVATCEQEGNAGECGSLEWRRMRPLLAAMLVFNSDDSAGDLTYG
jgi:hypothetical protein